MPFVYVLTNEWCLGLTKLGATDDVTDRITNLHSVLPGKSTLVWSQEVKDAVVVEKAVRERLNRFGIKSSRDWFHCPADMVVDQFKIYLENERHEHILEDLQLPNHVRFQRLVELGSFCRQRREAIDMTQKQLADLSGTGLRFIGELESGKATCQFDLVAKVCHLLGIDLLGIARSR
jgi:y4mF family transcriptional regulator